LLIVNVAWVTLMLTDIWRIEPQVPPPVVVVVGEVE
jgi:hypothetical protein